jgi:nodulation protein E
VKRVVITGIGVISALGHNQNEFWQALRGGCSGIKAIESLDTSELRFKNGAEVNNFDPTLELAPDALRLMDRFAQFAVLAAAEAVAQARVEWTPQLRRMAQLSQALPSADGAWKRPATEKCTNMAGIAYIL